VEIDLKRLNTNSRVG